MRATAFLVLLSIVLLSTAALADESATSAVRTDAPAFKGTRAEVPGLMNYQGTLTDGDGVALDTTVSMTFSIYSDSTGGATLWTETQPAVAVRSGLFNVLLGRVNSLPDTVFNDPERWLGVQVGGDPELSPRQRIASVGYAFWSAEADTAQYARNALGGSDGDWTISGSDIYSAVPGNVGIGTPGPASKLDVTGEINTSSLYKIGGNQVLSTTGTQNTFVGIGAGENNTSSYGTFVGYNAGYNNQEQHNTFLGRWAGYSNNTGKRNTFVASNAGRENTSGSYNVFVGYEAGRLCSTGVSNVFLGYRAGYYESGSNKLYIDNTLTSSPLIYGEFDNNIVAINGDMGIGTTTPTAKLDALNTGDNVGKLGTSEHGVYGESWDAVDLGGYFENRSTGVGGPGAYDNATALRAFSGTGTLDDIHPLPTLNYLYPGAAEFSGPNGVIGAASPDGYDGAGVVGVADGASQIPVYAAGLGDCNRVLYAKNWNHNCEAWLAGSTYGAYAWAESGNGLVGVTYDSIYVGVEGENTSSDNIGQLGTASAGVYGSASSGYAGDFSGAVRVSGFLFKLGGGFIIDHPLDPANQYLYHSFVESPDMMNVYNGNVLLDANGQAWVELPEWFETVNGEFRYQLTPIGRAAPGLHISKKISDNRFQIAGGEAGMEISWQVTGIRHDPSAKANRIPVEEYKPANERGYYLQPSVYGQPEEKGIDWALYKRNRQRIEELTDVRTFQGAALQDNR
jgi:hypothetical protein